MQATEVSEVGASAGRRVDLALLVQTRTGARRGMEPGLRQAWSRTQKHCRYAVAVLFTLTFVPPVHVTDTAQADLYC